MKPVADHTTALAEVLAYLEGSFDGDIRGDMQVVGHRRVPLTICCFCGEQNDTICAVLCVRPHAWSASNVQNFLAEAINKYP